MDVASAAKAGTDERFRRHLVRAKSRFGKAIVLSWWGRLEALFVVALIAAAIAGLVLVRAVRTFFGAPVPTWAVFALIAAMGFLAFLYLNTGLPRPLRWLADRLYTQALPALSAIPFWISSLVVLMFSRTFVAVGRVRRVLGNEPPA